MAKLTREEVARLEIGQTEIHPALAWTVVAAFLATLVAVPAIQVVGELQGATAEKSDSPVPGCARIVDALPAAWEEFQQSEGGVATKVFAANAHLLKHINEYEDQLEEESWLARRILAPTQSFLTGGGGVGNEKAYVGRDGWLFYRPGVDYVTGPGFLDPEVLAKRAASGNEYSRAPKPDPRSAILDFHKQLAERGIRLVLMPTPVKPMLEAEHFTTRYADQDTVLQNVSFEPFLEELENQGVLVFDPAPALLEHKRETGRPQYLETDTHWTPAAMEFVAKQLQEFLKKHVEFDPHPAAGYRKHSLDVSNLGDIAVMMKLPPDQTLYPQQSARIHQIQEPDGTLWEPDPSADVLLLGDSFSNVFSLAGLRWGESAGLAEQLSFLLQRPIDRIAQNDAGASATRQALALELARGQDRLAGKRVVVWQFAIRELAVGDWRQIPLRHPKPVPPEPTPQKSPLSPSLDQNQWLAEGRIVQAAGVPKPGSVPYRDAVTAVHLSEVTTIQGSAACKEAVVYAWGMRDNKWTTAARFQRGQRVTFKLTPWNEVQHRYGRFTRLELDDPDFVLIDLPTFWAEEVR